MRLVILALHLLGLFGLGALAWAQQDGDLAARVSTPILLHELCQRGRVTKQAELARLQSFVAERQAARQPVSPIVLEQIRQLQNAIVNWSASPAVQQCEVAETQLDADLQAARQEIVSRPDEARPYPSCYQPLDKARQEFGAFLDEKRSTDTASRFHGYRAEIARASEYVGMCEAQVQRAEGEAKQAEVDRAAAEAVRVKAAKIEAARVVEQRAQMPRYEVAPPQAQAKVQSKAPPRPLPKATPQPAKPKPVNEPLHLPTPECGPKPNLWVWNHSIRPVEKYLERTLNDPDSLKFEDDACLEPTMTSTKCWTSVCRYRAKNQFGGVVRKATRFWFTDKAVLDAKDQ